MTEEGIRTHGATGCPQSVNWGRTAWVRSTEPRGTQPRPPARLLLSELCRGNIRSALFPRLGPTAVRFSWRINGCSLASQRPWQGDDVTDERERQICHEQQVRRMLNRRNPSDIPANSTKWARILDVDLAQHRAGLALEVGHRPATAYRDEACGQKQTAYPHGLHVSPAGLDDVGKPGVEAPGIDNPSLRRTQVQSC